MKYHGKQRGTRATGAWVGGPGAWGPGGPAGPGRGLGPGGHGGLGGPGAWAGPGGMGGAPGAPPIAPTPSPAGGDCTIRATTRRRHAVKQLLMLQNPPPARVAGTTRTRGHDTNRTAQPRCLGAAATTAASPAEPSRAQPWLRRASRGPSLRCPDAPSHGHATQLTERIPPPGDNTSG